jgi:pyrroloquinoline quinone (PQQ) biosynthesis protein C
MLVSEWRKTLGQVVRDWIKTPEMELFYSIKVTPERARLYILQLSIYVRNRRNYWAQVAANCPVMEVKQRILKHEYEELVEDEYSDVGHLDLILRQGREVGLTQEQILAAEPLPSTKAAVYAWWWIARNRPWQEALAASSSAEWFNDDRLLGDLGGGNCTRLLNIWRRDLGFGPERMPNFVAHSKADERHSDMFTEVLEKYVPANMEESVIEASRESYDIIRVYFGGMATAMARIPD